MAETSYFKVIARDGAARAGVLCLPHGEVPTPVFMPVATHGALKAFPHHLLTAAPILLANTYHLYLRPGTQVLEAAGGLHRFMQWPKPILTDSGGYQVFSLAPLRKITPEGVTFRSHIDGSTHFLSPEKVVAIQLSIGSDIQMVLDVCPPYPASRAAVEAAMVHTTQWAFRAREAFARNPTCYGYQPWQFGIVQGGVHPDLREAHFRALESIPFEGWAVGGLAVGEPFDLRKPILHQMGTLLPSDKPRYVMGFGSPQDILEAIAAGMDMMDCVLPTRNARHGLLYTWEGIRNLRNARYQTDFTPIPPHGYTRAYLHHLFRVGDPLALVLTTEANLHFFLSLLHTARQAILAERFIEWRTQVEPQLLYRHPPETPSKRPPAETTP